MKNALVLTAGACALIAGLAAAPAPRAVAQNPTQAIENSDIPWACRPDRFAYDAEEEMITMTGSRLHRQGAAAPSPMLAQSPPPPPAPPPARVLSYSNPAQTMPQPRPGSIDRERYPDADPNPVHLVSEDPVSTFSIDVDTASYSRVRRSLHDCVLPPTDAVRIEEMVNYFTYDYPVPRANGDPFTINATVTPNPWNSATQLLHVGVQGYDIAPSERPDANLVFLIDVSGSMGAADKLPLAIRSLRMLVEELDPDDRIGIVVYAGAAGAVLQPTEVRNEDAILSALDRLNAGGSTAGGEGLRLAYALAEQNFDEEAVNRVILLTDGDFNVGVTSNERLEDFVARKRESGVYLSVLGFGRGNYNDALMQTLAQAGNGIAGYIDSEREARRLLVDEAVSSLFPIANDVKIQIEFNPDRIAEYRLIGYETRLLNREDFNNDAVDAGEVGSGHSVTALYEIAAPGSEGVLMEPLRYEARSPQQVDLSSEFGFLSLRYKRPGEAESQLLQTPITAFNAVPSIDRAPEDVQFAIHVAGFAQALRGDPYLRDGYSFETILEAVDDGLGRDQYGHREEFADLVDIARYAAAQEALKPSVTPNGRGR